MKNTKILFAMVAVSAILAWSCGKAHKSLEAGSVMMDSIAPSEYFETDYSAARKVKQEESLSFELNNKQLENGVSPETYISSSAALENPNDTARKMIRTANIKFRVKDVIKSTYNIENIVVGQGGFVENTNLTSQVNYTNEQRIKADSTLITTYYSVVNTLVLRVPSNKLDAALKEIAQLVDFMDYRVINAKDVTLDLLSKRLEQSRLARYDNRMKNAIDNKGKRLNDVSDAENNLLYKQEQADEAKLANLQIIDKIKYSTVNLSLYQNQSIKYEVVARTNEIQEYSTPFAVRFADAMKFGWLIITEFFLLLTHLWAIILVAVIVFFGWKYFIKKRKKNKKEL